MIYLAKLFSLGLVSLALITGGTHTGSAQAHPLKLDDHNRPMVEVTFENGDKHMLLLDTAARRTAFKNKLADNLGVEVRSRATIRHFSATGVVTLPYGWLPTLDIFGRTVNRNIVALYPDYLPANGLVGFDTLHEQVFRLNPKEGVIDAWSHSGQLAEDGWAMLQGRSNRGWDIVLKGTIQGLDMDILVATGSSHTLIDLDTARKLFPDRKFRPSFGTWNVHRGLNAKPLNLDTLVLEDFSIGPWQLGDLEVGVTRLKFDETSGLKGKNTMILGADVLMRAPIALDFRSQSVWIPPGGDG